MSKFMVIGDAILDHYVYGNITRLNPESSSVPLLNYSREEYKLGGALNVANSLRALGADVEYHGLVGDDEASLKVMELLESNGIVSKLYKLKPFTTVKSRYVHDNRMVLRLDREDTGETIFDLDFQSIDYDGIVVSDYAKGMLTSHLLDQLNGLGIPIYVDTKPSNMGLYKGVRLVTPNALEASKMGIKPHLGENCAKLFDAEYGIVTAGADGIYWHDTVSGDSGLEAAVSQDIVDVTGAGDSVIAALAITLTEGKDICEAVRYANKVAGVAVSRFGTYAVRKEDLE